MESYLVAEAVSDTFDCFHVSKGPWYQRRSISLVVCKVFKLSITIVNRAEIKLA
jgi:hypothetical protein